MVCNVRRHVACPDFLTSTKEPKVVHKKTHSKLKLAEQSNSDVTYQQKSLEERGRWVSMPSVAHPSTPTEDNVELPSPSRSRLVRIHERRFHRHFPSISSEDRLINYYHCALVSDILLQGYLYLSQNYFAFYSNIFGYKTKFLIPVGNVIRVTKERTAKIIPNAIGITTHEEKFVFGSLLSRDASYRLIHQIWKNASYGELCQQEESESGNTSPLLSKGIEGEDSVSDTSDQVTTDDVSSLPSKTTEGNISNSPSSRQFRRLSSTTKYIPLKMSRKIDTISSKCQPSKNVVLGITRDCFDKIEETVINIYKLPRTSLLLFVSTVLLVLLFFSATFLMYRIAMVHRRVANAERTYFSSEDKLLYYREKRKGQSKIINEEVTELTTNLRNRINQLILVRKSLAELMDVTIHEQSPCSSPSGKFAERGQWMVVGT
ncbi:GRAM domain-containing protein 1C-like isoform X2 [Limulus polyphemus]|nr:GRAM domain-containing protein 1C-like isoform X2 [Limulus polyphemus]XP_022238628.1 GRAM domain-containing protein 1C-like isoform X2 [Limulus polyphemus]XP_022238648.1 GRAM domain-containing protein 1C-like isoform X2 [Limulus polyphemus]